MSEKHWERLLEIESRELHRVREELATAHAKLGQMAAAMAAALQVVLDEPRRIFSERDCSFRAYLVSLVSDPDTASAGRLWDKLMAEHEAGSRDEGAQFRSAEWNAAYAAVEAERKG